MPHITCVSVFKKVFEEKNVVITRTDFKKLRNAPPIVFIPLQTYKSSCMNSALQLYFPFFVSLYYVFIPLQRFPSTFCQCGFKI